MPVAARKSTICRSSPRGLQTVVPRSASVGLEAWYAASQCEHVWRQCSGVCSHVHRRLNQPDPVSWAISWVPSIMPGSWDSFLVTVPDSWSKGCEFESRQERRENFLLQSQLCVLTFVRCPFHPRITQWHVKDPTHSAKSAAGRLHLNMHTPLTQRRRSGLTMPLFRHSFGT